MTKKVPMSKKTCDLRKRAENQKLVHELNVHQIELKMQNEALQKSQMETVGSQYKYGDLYDFAPIGYFTFDKKRHIIEANITGASLLSKEKRSLAKHPFQRFIVPGHLSIFQSHIRKAIETKNKQACKLRLVKRDGSSFDALIDTIAVVDQEGKFT
jgi:PAS domain-containing protein